MAGKKISELDELLYENIVNDDLITLVDSSETVPSNINKKITIEQFNDFLRNKSSVFPISFQESFIETKAYGLTVNGATGQERPISNTVSNKTVNLADVSTLKFDQYGRVWDLTTESQVNNVLVASGTAAGFFKGHIDSQETAGPGVYDKENTPSNNVLGGYFNKDTYYYPTDKYATLINYSDGTSNNKFWDHLFSVNYLSYDTTTVDINYSYSDSDTTYQPQPGNANIIIDWKNSSIRGTGSFPYYNSTVGAINFPVVWQENAIPTGNNIFTGLIQGATNKICVPKILINGSGRQITGLPIYTIISEANTITNQSIAVNVVITST